MCEKKGILFKRWKYTLVVQRVKNLPAVDLNSIPGWGRSPEEGSGNHSSVLAWRLHGQRTMEGYSPQEHDWAIKFRFHSLKYRQRANALEKTLTLRMTEGKWEEGGREWDGQMASPIQWTWNWAIFRREWRTGRPVCCSPWGHKELDTTQRLNNNIPLHMGDTLWEGFQLYSNTMHHQRLTVG